MLSTSVDLSNVILLQVHIESSVYRTTVMITYQAINSARWLGYPIIILALVKDEQRPVWSVWFFLILTVYASLAFSTHGPKYAPLWWVALVRYQ